MRKKAKTILIILILTAAALTAAASYFLYSFYVPDEQAEVLGNIRYTDAEIRRMAMPGFKEHNSLYLRYLRKEEEEQKEEKERVETEEIMAEGALQEPETGAESDTAFRPALTDVSQVSGLTEKPYAVGEQIQTDNTEIFGTLMTLGKLVNKLDIRPDEILIEDLIRSALASHTDDMINHLQVLAGLCNVTLEVPDRYPGWGFIAESPLRNTLREVLKERDIDLKEEAAHGGLECSMFKGLDDSLDIITYGPVAHGAHTPEEKLDLASFDRAFDVLCEVLARC